MASQAKTGIDIRLLLMIISLTGGVVASHFTGIAQSKDYTDKKISGSSKELSKQQKEMNEKVTQMQVDLAVIRQILTETVERDRERNE